jgi:hypothetical protein
MVVRRRRGGLGLTIGRERCNPKRVIEVSERALIGEVADRLAEVSDRASSNGVRAGQQRPLNIQRKSAEGLRSAAR